MSCVSVLVMDRSSCIRKETSALNSVTAMSESTLRQYSERFSPLRSTLVLRVFNSSSVRQTTTLLVRALMVVTTLQVGDWGPTGPQQAVVLQHRRCLIQTDHAFFPCEQSRCSPFLLVLGPIGNCFDLSIFAVEMFGIPELLGVALCLFAGQTAEA